MRESIGGTWLFGIVITFITLFSSFLAYSISYTRAFNVKSEILNIIEKDEGYTVAGAVNLDDVNLSDEIKDTTEYKIFQFIKSSGYNYTTAEKISCAALGTHGSKTVEPRVGGYCITKYCQSKLPNGSLDTSNKTYYKITTFIAIEIPVVDLMFKIPITGETRTLYYDSGNLNCDEDSI